MFARGRGWRRRQCPSCSLIGFTFCQRVNVCDVWARMLFNSIDMLLLGKVGSSAYIVSLPSPLPHSLYSYSQLSVLPHKYLPKVPLENPTPFQINTFSEKWTPRQTTYISHGTTLNQMAYRSFIQSVPILGTHRTQYRIRLQEFKLECRSCIYIDSLSWFAVGMTTTSRFAIQRCHTMLFDRPFSLLSKS